MPKKSVRNGPVPVEATIHADKRANLPTADALEFLTADIESIPSIRYPRDTSLDPQLVWKGKDQQDEADLEVDAPPIYIQEKIDPRVLIENLRATAGPAGGEPELTLFDTFDGLPELDLVEFYRHDANWSNRMILGDSLQVMASLAEREALRGKVQMIYLDPPYGIRFGSNWQVSARKTEVKDGKAEDTSREVEMIKAFRDTWELGIHSYLAYLRDRLEVARDLLAESGSVFVQIGDENVHLVRAVMDEVFGSENFVSQIAFKKTAGAGSPSGGTDVLAAVNDFLLWYGKDASVTKYRQVYRDKAQLGSGAAAYNKIELRDGTRRTATLDERTNPPQGARLYRHDNLTSQSSGGPQFFDLEIDGVVYPVGKSGWKTTETGMARLQLANRIAVAGRTPSYVRFLDDFAFFPYNNSWDDTVTAGFAADKIYVVQTNVKVIERCVLMTTEPGDLVLDPTCGSGTTAYAAELWGRRWITIDSSRVALALARQRLMGARFPYFLLADSSEGRKKEESLTGHSLPPAVPSGDIRRGFVYDRVRHITLKSIANNPDIVEGKTRAEIEAAIPRYADLEPLVDRPFADDAKVRVTGPFTVESLSPHRSLAFAGERPTTEVLADRGSATSTFEQTILSNLQRAGVQNGRRKERLMFDIIEPYAGAYVQAVGIRAEAADGPRKVGIAIGPQYGTVDAGLIKSAAREAIKSTDMDLLCVLGFAFDPQAVGASDDYVSGDKGFDVAAERSLGRVPVLLVRMNADLVMGESLKKTGTGNLFTVFGEPDIRIEHSGGATVVELFGVDVYDPTTGEVRSNSTDQIALWMIDTDYNGESFFVRHCYFTGGQDPYKRLKAALKSDIDEETWATLYRTVSRPFPEPRTGRIAVKVINDYGDEVLKVFDL